MFRERPRPVQRGSSRIPEPVGFGRVARGLSICVAISSSRLLRAPHTGQRAPASAAELFGSSAHRASPHVGRGPHAEESVGRAVFANPRHDPIRRDRDRRAAGILHKGHETSGIAIAGLGRTIRDRLAGIALISRFVVRIARSQRSVDARAPFVKRNASASVSPGNALARQGDLAVIDFGMCLQAVPNDSGLAVALPSRIKA